MRMLPAVFCFVLSLAGLQAVQPYGELPMQFEANAGQLDASVKLLARGAKSALYLTPNAAVLSLNRTVNLRMSLAGANRNSALNGVDPLLGRVNYLNGSDRRQWHTGIATFAKAKYSAVYPGIDLVYYGKEGRLEYDFIVAPGSDGRNIRMRFDGAQVHLNQRGQLVLNTGAGTVLFEKPTLYQMSGGVKSIVSGGFAMLSRGEVGFTIGPYDHGAELVIDPVLIYASFIGGAQTNQVSGIAPNSRGELYVTGYTFAINFPTTAGSVRTTPPVCAVGDCDKAIGLDAFVAKISADGRTLIYSTYLGGNNDDVGRAVTVDANDNAWVTGYTFSNDFPVTADAIQKLCSPTGVFSFTTNTFTSLRAACEQHPAGEANVYSQNAPDVFLTKLNPAGTQLLYSTFLGGSGNDNPNGLALDAQGNIYIAGNTSSVSKDVYPPGGMVNYPLTGSAYQSDVSDFYGFVSFLTKLSPDAHTILYSTIIGETGPEKCAANSCGNIVSSMALGKNGLVTLGGTTGSPRFPVTANALQPRCTLASSAQCYPAGFIATLNTLGSGAASLVYSTYLSGSLPDQAMSSVHGVAADSQGAIYVTGQTSARDFPTTPGTVQSSCKVPGTGACNDAFVLKLSPSNALAWSTYYGPSVACCTVVGNAIAVDANANVYVAGQNGGAYDLPQKNAFQPGEVGGEDVFLATLSPDGSQVLFGSYFGAAGNEIATSIALDPAGNIYFGGYTNSPDLPVTPGSFQTVSAGFQQGFVGKVSSPFSANPPSISANGIVSAGAFGGFSAVAPGSWIEIFGANLSATTRTWGSADFKGANAPTSLDGVQVSVGGQAAFVDYVSPSQVNALIPSNVTPGVAQVTVTNAIGTSTTFPITVNALQPGLLAPPSFQVGGRQYVAALFADGVTFVLPVGAIPGVPSRPAKPGETIILYGVGFGPVTPVSNAGTIVSQQNTLSNAFQLSFGATPAKLAYDGLAPNFTGLYQFNVTVPSVPDDLATPLSFTLAGTPGAQKLAIAIQQ